MIKAVFLDRDGVINKDSGYISHTDQFCLYPFAAESIKKLKSLGFLIFVVTNQSGIARGYYSLDDLEEIHQKMNDELKQAGTFVDEIFFSPYHQDGHIEPFNIFHENRKPGLGMFKEALKKYDFRINKSFMVGDRYTDIVFGKKAHLTTFLVQTGDGEKEFYKNRVNWKLKPDFIVKNLKSVVNVIEMLEIQCKN